MDGILEELDEAKADIERLRAECNTKGELSEKLKRVNSEQFSKLQEANLKIEKQAQELNEKEEELSLEKNRCEQLEKKLTEKESVLKHLSSANDKLRSDGDEKYLKMEEEMRSLLLALDDTNEKCVNQEQKISSYKEEIEGLKRSLSLSQRKFSDAEERSMEEKDLKERDGWITELNDENTKVKDQLKWKMEQFKHLEEAFEKVRDEFKVNKREWEMEKATLLDEISSLEMKLDSQMLISKDLQNKLEMCNQALTHEESRRKCLQVQVTEFQTRFENIFDQREPARMNLDETTAQRDEEIAALRCLLGTKDSFLKEREYQTQKLEQENQELRMAIKELQEAQIQEAGASSSLKKLQNKLKSLETARDECTSQIKAILSELHECKSELSRREATIKDFEAELEGHYSAAMQLKLQNEEFSAVVLVLNQGISEAQMKLAKEISEVDMHDKNREEKISLLMKQLEVQNVALVKANQDVEEERGKVASLTKKVEALDLVEEQLHLKQRELDSYMEALQESSLSQVIEKQYESKLKELDQYKEMFEESNRDHLQLKQQVLQIESDAREKLLEACTALEETSAELADKTCEGNQIDFEMHMWKSIAERLKVDLEENHEMRRELEAALLAEVQVGDIVKQEKDVLDQMLKEKDRRIESLEQQVTLLEQGLEIIELEATTLSGTESTTTSLESMRNSFLQTIREKDEILERLQNEVEYLEQESLSRELEVAMISQFGAEKMFEGEKEKLIRMVEMKNMRIDQLMKLVESLEQKFISSLASFSSKLDEKQEDISLVHRAWEKINAAEILAILETEEKKLMIAELEDSIFEIEQKLELQETSLYHAKEKAIQIEADLEVRESEMKDLTNHMKTKLTHSDAIIDELKNEKSNLIEDVMKLSSEKEELMGVIGGIGSHISQFCNSDKELMGLLEKIMLTFSNECQRVELKCDDELSFSRGNVNSPAIKRFEVTAESRSPFRELNG